MDLEKSFATLADEKQRGFVGRQWLVKRVQEWFADLDGSRFFVLVGEPGIGKSAFVSHLWRTNKLPHAVHFCIGGRGESLRPLKFVQSIAEQLAKRLPHFAEVLVQAQEKFPNRNINIASSVQVETVKDEGQVIGVNIHEIHFHEISPLDAFDYTLRDPLHTLSERQILPRVLIVVDALDEALSQKDRNCSIVSLLTQADDLPNNVRFLVTTRPEPRIMADLLNLGGLLSLIDANSCDNRTDIVNYLRNALDTDQKLRQNLAQWGWDESQSIEKLEQKSEGNFLYLSLLLPSIAAENFSTFQALPNGLYEVFQSIIGKHITDTEWSEWGAKLLTIVLAFKEPVSHDQISHILKWSRSKARTRLQKFSQLWDQSLLLAEEERYWRCHWSLVEFLGNEKLIKHYWSYWCDLIEGHSILSDYYLQTWGGLDAGLPKLRKCSHHQLENNYGLRYIVAHLETARRYQDMHRLLGLETSEQRNLWNEMKEFVGDAEGYLSDISLASVVCANAIYEDENENIGQNIGLLCRYALIRSSLNILARSIPPRLLVALVKEGLWSPLQGLAYIRMGLYRPQAFDSACALASLAPLLGISDTEKARKMLVAIGDPWKTLPPIHFVHLSKEDPTRDEAVQQLRSSFHEMACDLLHGNDEFLADETVCKLAWLSELLPPALMRELIDTMLFLLKVTIEFRTSEPSIIKERRRYNIGKLISKLPLDSISHEILEEAVTNELLAGGESHWFEYLSLGIEARAKIAHLLPNTNWHELVDLASSNSYELVAIPRFAALGYYMPEGDLKDTTLAKAISLIEVEDLHLDVSAQALVLLLPAIPKSMRKSYLSNALDRIREQTGALRGSRGHKAVDKLALHFTPSLLVKALNITRKIGDEEAIIRVSSIISVLEKLPRLPNCSFVDAQMLSATIKCGYYYSNYPFFDTLFQWVSYQAILDLVENQKVTDEFYFDNRHGKRIALRMFKESDFNKLLETGFWIFLDSPELEKFITRFQKEDSLKNLVDSIFWTHLSTTKFKLLIPHLKKEDTLAIVFKCIKKGRADLDRWETKLGKPDLDEICEAIAALSSKLIEVGMREEVLEEVKALLVVIESYNYGKPRKAQLVKLLTTVLTELGQPEEALPSVRTLISEIDRLYCGDPLDAVSILIPLLAELGAREEALEILKAWLNQKEDAISRNIISESSWPEIVAGLSLILAQIDEKEEALKTLKRLHHNHQAKAIISLIPELAPSQLIELLGDFQEDFEEEGLEEDRRNLITTILERLLIQGYHSEVVSHIKSLNLGAWRISSLIKKCSPVVSEKQLRDLMDVCGLLEEPSSDTWGILLINLAKLGYVDEALERTHQLIAFHSSWKWKLWPLLAPYFTESVQENVLNALLLEKNQFPHGQKEVLLAMIDYLDEQFFPLVLAVYRSIKKVQYKAPVLAAMIPHIEPQLLEEMLDEIIELTLHSNTYHRRDVLKILIPKLSVSERWLSKVLSMINLIDPAEDRVELLNILTSYMSMDLLFEPIVRILRQSSWEDDSIYNFLYEDSWRKLVSGIDEKKYLEQLVELLPQVPDSAQEKMLAEIRILEFNLGIFNHKTFPLKVLEPIQKRFLKVITDSYQSQRDDTLSKLEECSLSLVALGGIEALLEFHLQIRTVARWWP